MNGRKGERLGWALGWLGGFAWVAVLAAVFAFQGRWIEAGVGLVLVAAAAPAVVLAAPWRHPYRAYWQLMAPLYGLLALGVAWAVWANGGAEPVSAWDLLWLIPLLMPLASIGRRNWQMGETARPDLTASAKQGEHDV